MSEGFISQILLTLNSQSNNLTEHLSTILQVTVRRGELSPEGGYLLERPLSSSFRAITLGPNEDRYTLPNLSPSTYYQVEVTASNQYGQSAPQSFIFRTGDRKCDVFAIYQQLQPCPFSNSFILKI